MAEPLLFDADGYRFPDVYHTTRFLAPDPIIALEDVEELVVVASSFEEGRVRKESRATTVVNMNQYGAQELLSQSISGPEFLGDAHGARSEPDGRVLPATRGDRARAARWMALHRRRRARQPRSVSRIMTPSATA